MPQHRPDAARDAPTSRVRCSCSRATSSAPTTCSTRRSATRATPATRRRSSRRSARARSPATIGANGWISGPNPTYKFGDQWVVSDRTLLDVQYSHVGGNFILDFHDPALADIQPTLVVAGTINGRSGAQSVNIRPANSLTANLNYFMPGKLWGDHAFKIGGYWRDNYARTISVTGGHATARFPTSVEQRLRRARGRQPQRRHPVVRREPHARRRHHLQAGEHLGLRAPAASSAAASSGSGSASRAAASSST